MVQHHLPWLTQRSFHGATLIQRHDSGHLHQGDFQRSSVAATDSLPLTRCHS